MRVLGLGLFFRQQTTTAHLALALQGDIQWFVVHFLAAAPNRFLVDAGNERELSITGTLGFL